MSDIIAPGVKKVALFKVVLNFKNGAKETIFSKSQPNIDQFKFLHLRIDGANGVAVNLDDVRKFEVNVTEETEVKFHGVE